MTQTTSRRTPDDLDTSDFGVRRPAPAVARLIGLTRRQPDNWIGRRLSFLLRRLALRRIDGPVDTRALGANLRLYPFGNICENRILFTPQYFDVAERDLIRSRLHDRFVFIDIGANIGGYALSIAAAAPSGARILAVEPQPDIFERLVYNIGQNSLGAIKAIACAVADQDGELTLFLDEANRGQSSVKFPASEGRSGGTIKVPSKTLLTLARDEGLGHIDAVKLDTAGAEDLIIVPFLRDAPKALWPKLLIIEDMAERWQTDIFAMLVQHGYRRVLQTRLNVGFERD